jgi:hypothetical protein
MLIQITAGVYVNPAQMSRIDVHTHGADASDGLAGQTEVSFHPAGAPQWTVYLNPTEAERFRSVLASFVQPAQQVTRA